MEDVARVAGVSHQTVSRVLNNHPNVSTKTRERVEQAITELGYRRNTAARSLVTRRSQTIGVLGSELAQYGGRVVAAEADLAEGARQADRRAAVEGQAAAGGDAVAGVVEQAGLEPEAGGCATAEILGAAKAQAAAGVARAVLPRAAGRDADAQRGLGLVRIAADRGVDDAEQGDGGLGASAAGGEDGQGNQGSFHWNLFAVELRPPARWNRPSCVLRARDALRPHRPGRSSASAR